MREWANAAGRAQTAAMWVAMERNPILYWKVSVIITPVSQLSYTSPVDEVR